MDVKNGIIIATDFEIYTEPKPEPQFEIGELVMMRIRGGIKIRMKDV